MTATASLLSELECWLCKAQLSAIAYTPEEYRAKLTAYNEAYAAVTKAWQGRLNVIRNQNK